VALQVRRSVGIAGPLVFLVAVAGTVYATLMGWNPLAASHADRPALSSGIDFLRDPDANYAAAQGLLSAHLATFPNYAGDRMVSYGIEVEWVGSPSDAVRAVVARDDPQYLGKPIPVRFHSVRHTFRELQALMSHIEADHGFWQQQGMQWSGLGPNPATNTVDISLFHYTKDYGAALIARYGSDWVTVYLHDVELVGD
jgi:hypothetical protein